MASHPELPSTVDPSSHPRRAWVRRWLECASLPLLLASIALYGLNAWVLDDAYITFRSIYNFINGYGLTWNTNERVQTYTHPLWMLLHLPIIAVTREFFFSGVALSFVMTAAALAVVWRHLRGTGQLWKYSVFLLALLASKAIFDYSSSGLENPLSYLLAALFFLPWLTRQPGRFTAREVSYYFLLCSLSFANRQDTVLIFAPALLCVLLQAERLSLVHLGRRLLWATSPAWAWLLFSLWYYGFAFPNTYYAKAGSSGVPFADRVVLGLEYLGASFGRDVWTLLLLLAATGVGLWRRRYRELLLLAGPLLYLLYVLTTAASATHMTHRFVAVPAFVCLLFLVQVLHHEWLALSSAVAAVGVLLAASNSPLRIRHPSYQVVWANNAIDTKWYVHQEGATLVDNLRRKTPFLTHAWFQEGLEFRRTREKVRWGGSPGGGPAMGYFGFGAGPEKVVVDPVGLCDPLLARLPAVPERPWRAGHYFRFAPAGYLESLKHGNNQIQDPDLRLYYEHLRRLTQGSLLDVGRLGVSLKMQFHGYDDLLERYVARTRQ